VPFPLQLAAELILRRENPEVASGEDLLALAQDGVSSYGLVLPRTEDQADGGVVAVRRALVVEEPNVTVHLSDVLMTELADLEVDEKEALQDGVVEDQVHVEVLVLEYQTLLARDERKSATQLEKKGLELLEDCSFENRLAQSPDVRQVEKIQDIGVFQRINRFFDHLAVGGKPGHARFAPPLEQAIKK